MPEQNPTGGEAEGRGPLVLVIDDSEDIADVYRLVLVHSGYRVAVAPDGGVGLRIAEELGPDLIILDMVMPNVSGLEFLERLPKLTAAPLPPVIVNSALIEYRAPAMKLGAALFLQKPVAGEVLVAAIEMVLGGVAPSEELLQRQTESVARAALQTSAERELLLASIDNPDAAFHERLQALVEWLTGFFGYGVASIDVLTRGRIRVVSAGGDGPPPNGAVVAGEQSFSTDVIVGESPLLVGDTTLQPSFGQAPAARRGYRFYAGVPLWTSKGVIGSLSLTDHLPHQFHGEDMTILEHVALGIARHTEALAVGQFLPALFDQPGLFQRGTLQLLLSTALRRATRDRGAIELAMLQLGSDDGDSVRRCADTIYGAADRTGLVIARYAPGVVAVLKYGQESRYVSASIDAAIAALEATNSSLIGAGIVQYDVAGGTLVGEAELERIADETRVRAVSTGGGRVERVILRSERPSEAPTPTP